MIHLLDIIQTSPDGRQLLIGQLAFDSDSQDFEAELLPSHPMHPNLAGVVNSKQQKALMRASLIDCVPDDWGKMVIEVTNGLSGGQMADLDYLPYINSVDLTTGAISFIPKGDTFGGKRLAPRELTHDLVDIARQVEDPTDLSPLDLSILAAVGTPGGIRPKALIHLDGKACLAKFESGQDRYDVIGAEFMAMSLARKAGLDVPEAELFEINNKKVLVQQRFDIPEDNLEGRYPVMSFRALSGRVVFAREDVTDLAKICRQFSADPLSDLPKLFKRMVFNAIIGNGEDHQRNFAMIKKEEGWVLAPAYDLTISMAADYKAGLDRRHTLTFNGEVAPIGSDFIKLSKAFGLTKKEAAAIALDIAGNVENNLEQALVQVSPNETALIRLVVEEGIANVRTDLGISPQKTKSGTPSP